MIFDRGVSTAQKLCSALEPKKKKNIYIYIYRQTDLHVACLPDMGIINKQINKYIFIYM